MASTAARKNTEGFVIQPAESLADAHMFTSSPFGSTSYIDVQEEKTTSKRRRVGPAGATSIYRSPTARAAHDAPSTRDDNREHTIQPGPMTLPIALAKIRHPAASAADGQRHGAGHGDRHGD